MSESKTFESALARLEEIVTELEEGNASLEQAIEMFEEGMQLAGQCAKKLNDAERKLKKLVKTEKGFQLDLLEDTF